MSAIFSRSLASITIAAALILSQGALAAEIPWSTDIEDALQRATDNGQPVLMEFTADWCVFCKKMEKTTFASPEVAKRISENFVAVKVNADENKALVHDLGIKGLPAILIVSPDLNVIQRISGFQTPEALVPKLDAVIASRPKPAPAARVATAQLGNQSPRGRQQLENVAAPNEEAFAPSATPSRPRSRELEFEAIAQDETARTNQRPIANPQNQPSQDIARSQAAPSTRATANTGPVNADSESFFKTISQEAPANNKTPKQTAASFGGLCLVSAVENRELVDGSARNQIMYRGHTLYFSSPENKDRFLAAPATYWPMLDGKCAMSLIDNDESVEGSLEFAALFRNRVWLFVSKEAMQEFLLDPADIVEEAQERFSQPGR